MSGSASFVVDSVRMKWFVDTYFPPGVGDAVANDDAELPTSHVEGWRLPFKPDDAEGLLTSLRHDAIAPSAKEAFGDARSTADLVQVDPDVLIAEGVRSEARMSLITRMVYRAGGNCALVEQAARQIPLAMKDDREGLLRSEIRRAYALFLAWWQPEKKRRDEQTAEARAIGEEIGESVLTDVMSLTDMVRDLVFIRKQSAVAHRSTARIGKWTDAMGDYAASRHVWIDEGGKKHNTAALSAWRAHEARITVDEVTWRPDQGVICEVPEPMGGNTRGFNLWRGFRLLVTPPDWQLLVRPFLEHVAYLVPVEQQRKRFLQWLAHGVQKPGELPMTCFLMVARQTGIGRNWLACILARVLAGHVALGVSLPDLLDGAHNGRLAQKIFATVDESREGARGDRHQRGQAFKRLVTETMREINEKYGLKYVALNCLRWLLFSNYFDAIPFDDEDRRVEVIENPTVRLPEEYFVRLYALLRDPQFVASVRMFLATFDISDFNPGAVAGVSAAKEKALESLRNPIDDSVMAFKELWPGEVAGRSDLARFVMQDTRMPPSEKGLDWAMERAGIQRLGSKFRVRIGAERERPIVLRTFTVAEVEAMSRAALAESIGRSRDAFRRAESVPACPS